MRALKRHDGFTLLELLVSIAIFAVMVVLLVQIMQDAAFRQRAVEEYTLATIAANNKLESLKSEELLLPQPMDMQLEFEPDENILKLREGKGTYSIEKFKDDTLVKLIVTISWKDMEGRTKHISLSSLKGAVSLAQE